MLNFMNISGSSPAATLVPTSTECVLHPERTVEPKLDSKHASEGCKDQVETNDDRFYVQFEEKDPRNPINYSFARKRTITLVVSAYIALAAAGSSSYALGWPSMTHDLHTTNFRATIGISTYALGYAIVPLIISSISEDFGRQPIYLSSAILFALTHLMVALAPTIQVVLVARFLGGVVGSGSTLAAGTIADIWLPHERGLPMSIFSVAAVGATGLGPVFAGYVEMNPHLQWRWIQWIHLILVGVLIAAIALLMKETRADILLTRIAKRMRKKTGDQRYRARVEEERASLRTLIFISLTRPVYFMFTEPVVASFSIWIGFAWGILYVLVKSISPVFRTLHNFSIGSTGLVFITFLIGSILGMLTNQIQERFYHANFSKRGPEARLYHAMFAGVLFPVSMFIYAWCTFPSVTWVALTIAITLFVWAMFMIYLSVFNYLADCYGPFASSALAGQALCRNTAAITFPLFTQQMYSALTYKWANTIFAFIATLMIPIPFVLFIYGPQIRARSKFASHVIYYPQTVNTTTIDTTDTDTTVAP